MNLHQARKINIEHWERREQYLFFQAFDAPFYGLTFTVDCTNTYRQSKSKGESFYLSYLHKVLLAINQVPAFTYRIIDGEVYAFDEVHVSATVFRKNKSFGFSHIPYSNSFKSFAQDALKEIERVQATDQLMPLVDKPNVIHFSAIPWVDFTSLSHAHHSVFNDSCPKVSVGKMTEKNGQYTMPVAVHVHHALVDGFHIGQFVDQFQALMNGTGNS